MAGGEGAEGGEAEAAVEMVLSGAVALVVFRGALAELPKEVATLARFLDVLRPFSFPGTGAIAEVRTSQGMFFMVLACCLLSRDGVWGCTHQLLGTRFLIASCLLCFENCGCKRCEKHMFYLHFCC